MIYEEDAAKHAGLPAEQRFYLTERLARDRLAAARRAAAPESWPEYDDVDYMIEVLAASEAFGIEELDDWHLPEDDDDRARAVCRSFRREATKVSQKLMFRYAGLPTSDPNTVAFDAATKAKLRFHLGQVRRIIDEDAMPDWKKQELYNAISELEGEIDKARTRLAAVVDVLGKAWDGEIRAPDALRQIIMIFQDAKAKENERTKLIASPETKRIEDNSRKQLVAPTLKQVTERKRSDKNLDDEIPF